MTWLTFAASAHSMLVRPTELMFYVNEIAGAELCRRSAGRN